MFRKSALVFVLSSLSIRSSIASTVESGRRRRRARGEDSTIESRLATSVLPVPEIGADEVLFDSLRVLNRVPKVVSGPDRRNRTAGPPQEPRGKLRGNDLSLEV